MTKMLIATKQRLSRSKNITDIILLTVMLGTPELRCKDWDENKTSFGDYNTNFQGYKNTVSILKIALEVINNNTDIGEKNKVMWNMNMRSSTRRWRIEDELKH